VNVVEYTGEYEHVLRTLKGWREVVDYLAGKFSQEKHIGGPELPATVTSMEGATSRTA
jgi:hypothetical protein